MAEIDSAQYTRGGYTAPSLLVPEMRRDASLRALETLHARLQGLDMSGALVYDFDQVHASALPHLAEQFGVLGDAGWGFIGSGPEAEAKQRALLKAAIALHRLKGTRYAVERALALLGVSARITEWWQQAPPGLPYTFGVDIFLREAVAGQPVLNAQRMASVLRVVNFWKNARSALRARVGVGLSSRTRTATVLRPAALLRADMRPSTRHTATPAMRVSRALRCAQRVSVLMLPR